MSNAALTWAWRRPIDDTIAKFALCLLADQAGNRTLKSVATVAEMATTMAQTERNVQRKLRWLEENGYIRVSPNKNGGRQRANDYYLLIDEAELSVLAPDRPAPPPKKPAETGLSAPADDVEPMDDPTSPLGAPMGDVGSPLEPGRGDRRVTPGGDSGVTPIESSTCNTLKNPSLSQGSAPAQEAGAEGERAEDSRIEDEFDRLSVEYGARAGMDLGRALRSFANLPVKARQLAMRQAAIARESRGPGKKYPKDLANWLDDKDYEIAARLADTAAQRKGLKHALVWVRLGTPAFEAWWMHHAKADRRYRPKAEGGMGMRPFTTHSSVHKSDGRFEASLFPPGGEGATGPPGDDEGDGLELGRGYG